MGRVWREATMLFTPDKRVKALVFKHALEHYYHRVRLEEIQGYGTLYLLTDRIAYNEEDLPYLIGKLHSLLEEQRRRLGLGGGGGCG